MWSDQITVRLSVGTANTLSQLMKFRKPKLICIVDQDRICIGDIDAILHNICRDQQIKFVMIKIMDNFLQLRWRHLPVSIPDRKPGDQISYHRGHLIYIYYLYVYEKDRKSTR